MERILVFFAFFTIFVSHELKANNDLDRDKKTICLNMIVKDESKVIKRCLESVKPIIDYWVIVDTGSTDGTQQIIKDFMKDIPGELHERPWVNFGHNRDEALKLAKNKGDYLLFIDADEYLVFEKDFKLPVLKKDFYYCQVLEEKDGSNFKRALLINNLLDWKWEGIIHEELKCNSIKDFGDLFGVYNMTMFDGKRSEDPQKYYKDAMLLEKALEKEPNNPRYQFYLAKSYALSKEYSLALKNFEKRSLMGGDPEEVFWSLYMVGKLKMILQHPLQSIIDSFTKAFQFKPLRKEPLYYLGKFYSEINGSLGYLVLKTAMELPNDHQIIIKDSWIYDYGLAFAFAFSSYNMNKFDEAYLTFSELLSKEKLPQNVRNLCEQNILIIRPRCQDHNTKSSPK